MFFKNLIIAGALFFSSFSYSANPCSYDFRTTATYIKGSEAAREPKIKIHVTKRDGWFSDNYGLCRVSYARGYSGSSSFISREVYINLTEEEYYRVLRAEDPFELAESMMSNSPNN